ncbi:hypothetical protein SAMN05216389_101259 [Oceanobacillus limi]|uniref:Uncharacterized protein n=1 Tax=Oceanobacillus limi TaxID=930131 RepID=A0A1H9Y8S0_9BACI|nr:hypothetical protein [Oceanobacillus limi]SES65218.1 hypothetical protein SAMN05216389_101259 [Oceanobacillus limi]
MDRIQLQHPEGKKGSNIIKSKYDVMKKTMLETMEEYGEISFKELTKAINEKLHGKFDGSITWHVTAVKLDLEARGYLVRFLKNKQQYIKRTEISDKP